MKRINLIEQLNKDYPDTIVKLDAKNNMLTLDNHHLNLLADPDELQNANVLTIAGRNYYQAISQLIYSKYDLLPKEGSLADSLITTSEELNNFRIQNLSNDYGIGFLEDGDEVIAVKVDSDVQRTARIEEDERIETPDYIKEIEHIDEYGKLIEIIGEADKHCG